MPLTPDRKYNANGLTVYEYLLTSHNPYHIDMPSGNRKKTVAITIHNTGAISVPSNTTPAEQYVRATVNGNMNDVRVHFYVDDVCAWQCLPFDWVNWSCADGCANPNSGNNTSVAIEVIGNSAKAEANAIKLTAYLLKKYNLNVDNGLRTHTYWLNVKDGKTGTIDYLNTAHNDYKMCPLYILPHWSTFKSSCAAALKNLGGGTAEQNNNTSSGTVYRIRKSWTQASTQIGAYSSLENAKKAWKEGYIIYDGNGKAVYPVATEKKGEKKTPAKNINITYRVRTSKWLSEITNCNDTSDMGYAGIDNVAATCLVAKASEGTIRYRVHILGGGWLGWITAYNTSDWYKGYAGLPTQKIDAIQAELVGVDGYDIQYRTSSIGQKNYYSWVIGLNDYAGVFGRPVDKIQMKVIKK